MCREKLSPLNGIVAPEAQAANKLNAWLVVRKYANCKRSEDARWLEETLIHLGYRFIAWQRLLKVRANHADIDQSDIMRQHLQEAVAIPCD